MLEFPHLVKEGTILEDNDPRYGGRRAMVNRLVMRKGVTYAQYFNGKHMFKIRLDRINDDGVKRKKGWSVIPNAS